MTVASFTTEPYAPRRDLLLSTWLSRQLPPRDFLLGNVLCTTSRWLIFGETGVGKTLFAVDLAGSIASGDSFLSWKGSGRSACVMYLDGEMPAETFKERMELIAQR
jgi:RecA-family ATPase